MSSRKRTPRRKTRQKRKPSLELLRLLAHNLKALREAGGLSQAALAERCGMRPTQISNVEQIPDNITLAVLETIAKGLGCPVYFLLRDGLPSKRTRDRASTQVP